MCHKIMFNEVSNLYFYQKWGSMFNQLAHENIDIREPKISYQKKNCVAELSKLYVVSLQLNSFGSF